MPSAEEIARVAAELRAKHFAEKRSAPPPKPSRVGREVRFKVKGSMSKARTHEP